MPDQLRLRVADVLQRPDFITHAQNFDRLPLIGMANALNGPTMRLVHWKTLADLGRLPNWNENHDVDAVEGIESFGAPMVEIFMVSHRWLRPSLDRLQAHPDSESNEKAEAINQFSLWRREWVHEKHSFYPEIFYWIDYCCIDQSNTDEAVILLPLWVACCERFLRYETADYHERAWCRIEPLLSYVFSFADHHTIIDKQFRHQWPYYGHTKDSVLLDPGEGLLTDPADMERIRPLIELACRAGTANPNGDNVSLNRTNIKCFKL